MRTPMWIRELAWERENMCRDTAGQAHFPASRISMGEMDIKTTSLKSIPKKLIKWNKEIKI
jgi:hypothetical protein